MNNNTKASSNINIYTIGIILSMILLFYTFMISVQPIISERLQLIDINESYKNESLSLEAELNRLKKENENLLSEKALIEADINTYITNEQELSNRMLARLNAYNTLATQYSYALNYGGRADFNLEDLVYLNDICAEYGVPVPIMLALYEKESSFYSKAKNPTSTATGYGQLIDSTAKSMYERFLNLGTYDMSNHVSLCSDKKLNMLLSVRLIKYNIDNYGDYRSAIEHYYNNTDQSANYAYASDILQRVTNYGSI